MFELLAGAPAPFYIPLSLVDSLKWNHNRPQTDGFAVYFSRVVLCANYALNFDHGTDWNEWGKGR
jgi:hypothetical protein